MEIEMTQTVIPEVVGPYCEWPRRDVRRKERMTALLAGSVVAAAIFLNCAVPVLV